MLADKHIGDSANRIVKTNVRVINEEKKQEWGMYQTPKA